MCEEIRSSESPDLTQHVSPPKFEEPAPVQEDSWKKLLTKKDPSHPRNLFAAGKKLRGMCVNKSPDKGRWSCSNHFQCPTSLPNCPGFTEKPVGLRSLQSKKKGLEIPPGMSFLYFGRPWGPHSGATNHHGVMTVAFLPIDGHFLQLGFAFCHSGRHSGDPKKRIPVEPFCKSDGRDEAMKKLYDDPVICPYYYSPTHTAWEVALAVLRHDFKRFNFLVLPPNFGRSIPSWTKKMAKKLDQAGERQRRLRRLARKSQKFSHSMRSHIKDALNYSLHGLFIKPNELSATKILAEMDRDIRKLTGITGNPGRP